MATTVSRELVTTGTDIAGYKVTRHLGVVRGITVRSRSIVGTLGGALQTLAGGNISLFTELCENSRQERLTSCCWRTPLTSARTRSSRCATTRPK